MNFVVDIKCVECGRVCVKYRGDLCDACYLFCRKGKMGFSSRIYFWFMILFMLWLISIGFRMALATYSQVKNIQVIR